VIQFTGRASTRAVTVVCVDGCVNSDMKTPSGHSMFTSCISELVLETREVHLFCGLWLYILVMLSDLCMVLDNCVWFGYQCSYAFCGVFIKKTLQSVSDYVIQHFYCI